MLNNKMSEIIQDTIKNLSSIIDANTIVGNPINDNEGNIIIPISNVSFCLITGGGEYGKINIFSKNDLPYSAGNGSVVNIKPCGFLVKNKDGYQILPISDNNAQTLINKACEIIEKMQ